MKNTVEQLKKILLAEISKMPKRKTLALLLSGGIDSSLVLALLREVRPNQPIRTFTVARSKDYPDVVFARKIASLYKTQHQEILPTPEELETQVREFHRSLGETPNRFRGDLSLFILCRETKKHTDILVTGDGGDEVFGGYWLHSYPLGHRETGKVKSFAEIHPAPAKHIEAMVNLGYRDFYFKKEPESADYDAVWRYFADIMLKRHVEPLMRITKTLNLQVYTPFWTPAALDFIRSLECTERIGRKLEKELARAYLPVEIIDRESVGFDVALEGEITDENMFHQQVSTH